MGKVQLLRSQMSKTKDMMMTVGIDEKRHMDADHDMYFLRIYLNLRKMLDQTNDINVIQISKLANRYLAFFRNDDSLVTINSIDKILQYCEENNINEVAFNEHEINKLSPSDLDKLVNKYNIDVYILIER